MVLWVSHRVCILFLLTRYILHVNKKCHLTEKPVYIQEKKEKEVNLIEKFRE